MESYTIDKELYDALEDRVRVALKILATVAKNGNFDADVAADNIEITLEAINEYLEGHR